MYIILELVNSIFLFFIAVRFFKNMDIHENTDSFKNNNNNNTGRGLTQIVGVKISWEWSDRDSRTCKWQEIFLSIL